MINNKEMSGKKLIEKVFSVLCCFCIFAFTNGMVLSRVGVNYGRLGNNLPSPYQSIEYLRNMKVGWVKLYDANPELLKLLSGTRIQVSIMVPNEQISLVASSQEHANRWVRANFVAYYPYTMIRCVLVGNEVLSYNDTKMWGDLLPAMRNIKNAIRANNIWNIKVGTPLAMDMMESTFPPSSGRFRYGVEKLMASLLRFFNGSNSFFFLDVYPYFPWSSDQSDINLDFTLFRSGTLAYTDPVSGLSYTNLLDQILDSVIFAMEKLGYSFIRMAIAETGWPNGGDIDEPWANIYNADVNNRNLVQKMSVNPPIGTPARPGTVIPTFLFSLYNENRKSGRGTERHWGLLDSNGQPMYELDMTRVQPESSYSPLPLPTNNQRYKGKLWCVVAQEGNILKLLNATSLVCAQGTGICNELGPDGQCFQAFTTKDYANYAFSSYWANFRSTGATCFLNGLAMQTTKDPSKESVFLNNLSLN